MCKCCSTGTKQICVFGCGVFILLVALILGLLWPTLALNMLYSRLTLEEGSLNFDNWIETPLPLYMKITMFNWTNSEDVLDLTVKPKLTELGPYVFLEHHKRVNVTWNENGTVTFNQIKTWQFMSDMSNGSLADEITTLNVITASVVYELRHANPLVKVGANVLINTNGASLFVTKTVGEFLFDGYQDQLLDYLRNVNTTLFNIPTFDKFGWFVERNGSWSYDGEFNMNTGQTDITKMGMLNLWNGRHTTEFYSDGCSVINGTTGELWPPKLNPGLDLTLFVSDICRSISLAPDNVGIEKFGVQASRWIGDERVFDNGESYAPNQCFCTADECPDLPSGVLNISECRFGAPAFMSFPHFYLADPSFAEAVDGLNASQEKHEFSMAIEPSTGIPLEVSAKLQVNILLQPISGFTLYQNVPHVMIPMVWFEQTVDLDDNTAASARRCLRTLSEGVPKHFENLIFPYLFGRPYYPKNRYRFVHMVILKYRCWYYALFVFLAVMLPTIGVYAAYGIAGIGAILLIVGITLTLTNSWNPHSRLHDESDNELRT